MPEVSLYTLALLACPVGMGVMMWMMMRGKNSQPAEESGKKSQPAEESTAHKQAELVRMQAEIDQLRAADRDRKGADAVRRPSP